MATTNVTNKVLQLVPGLFTINTNNLYPVATKTMQQNSMLSIVQGLHDGTGGLNTIHNLTRKPERSYNYWNSGSSDKKKTIPSTGSVAASTGIGMTTDYLSKLVSDLLFGESELGRGLGTLFSSGISSTGNTIGNNILKGTTLTKGLGINAGVSLASTGVGIAGNYIGKGINSLGGDSMLSRGIGLGIATGIGAIGGDLISGGLAVTSLKKLASIPKAMKEAKATLAAAKTPGEIAQAQRLVNNLKGLNALSVADKWNLAGLGGQIVGSGLLAAFGPSKEYGGKYGGITQGMDMGYDLIQSGVGFLGPVGTGVSGIMALNKGLSNIFGSTDGMTVLDAILGSAFMPAPVKWLNMWGSSKTGTFNNLSWQNSEKANSFMGDAFGNLNDRFNLAREEAGKTYGLFSLGAKEEALKNINFANYAWEKIMNMADLNEIQNIRSQLMSSINNQKYALMILGGYKLTAIGKQGMKILNNATNHNIGMRLLSGAALIDNKQMILCNVPD